MGRPRQPPRRLGQRRRGSDQRHGGAARGGARRSARCSKTGWRPKRTIVYCRVGRRGAGAARLDRVGRDARGRARTKARRVHQHRRQRPRLPRRRRLPLARALSSTRWRATSRTRRRNDRSGSARALGRSPQRGTADDAARRSRDRRDLALDALGSGSDYTPFLQHLGIASLNLGFGGESDGGSTTRSTTASTWYTRSATPRSPTAARWRKTVGLLDDAARGRRRPALRVRRLRRDGRPLRRARSPKLARRRSGRRPKSGTADRGGTCRGRGGPEEAVRRAEAAASRCRTSTSRRSRTRSDALTARRGLLARLRRGVRSGDGARPTAQLGAVNARCAARARAYAERGLPGRPWYRH